MLKRLKLQNLALIEIIEINFEKGLNVFTGESGSGKSLILDSLDSLFGGTNIPLKHLIRPGKNECFIEASFEITTFIDNWLKDNNFYFSDKYLSVLRYSYKKNSKIISKYKLNNQAINKKLVQKLGYLLIDFSGQNDKYLFNNQDYLRNIIDDIGSKKLKDLNNYVKKTFFKLNTLQKDINLKIIEMQNNKDNYFANNKILQILEEADLTTEDEINLLKSKQLKLANNYELKNAFNTVLHYLNDFRSEDSSVNFLVIQSIKQLNRIIKYDENINQISEKLINIQNEIEDLTFLITNYLESIDHPEDNLEIVQARLFKLQNLEKSFSLDLPNLIQKRNDLRNIPTFDYKQEEIIKLKKEYSDLNGFLKILLQKQSSIRKKIAHKFEKSVTVTLKELGLPSSNFSVDLKEIEPKFTGKDHIQFLFSANPDQKLANMTDVISGGELSRFLLALKFNISIKNNIFFFDEIDNGLSGKSLLSTMNLIKKISLNQQTLCITHQPLLASIANSHYKVKKNINDGSTFTSLIHLKTLKQKQNELAELIGGGFKEASNYALTLLNEAAA